MAGFAGREIELTWGSNPIDGVREKGISLNGEPINVTSDEDDGKQTLLDISAEDSVTITISGVTKSSDLRDDWFNGNRTATATLTYPDGYSITGTFFLSTYEETGAYNDATTFTATLNSSGAVSGAVS